MRWPRLPYVSARVFGDNPETYDIYRGLIRHGMTFFISTAFALIGSLLLLIGAAIWTVVINKSDAINDVMVGSTPAPLGIIVSIGPALYMLWAAFAVLLVSVVPYMLVYVYLYCSPLTCSRAVLF